MWLIINAGIEFKLTHVSKGGGGEPLSSQTKYIDEL